MSARRGKAAGGRLERSASCRARRRSEGAEAAPAPLEATGPGPASPGPQPWSEGGRRGASANLGTLQNWMQAVITDPAGIGTGERSAGARRHIDHGPGTIEQVCESSASLSARDRIGIYANMYFWRLVDILADEFPTVQRLAGDRRFYRLAVEFLVAHPSRSYSLNFLGVPFAEFVAKEAKTLARRGLLADVARVERAIEDVFDAPAARPLSTRAFRKIPMARWAAGRLVLTKAMKLLELDHPVNGLIAAVRDGRKVRLPRKAKERLVVYRVNGRVWRAPLSRESFTLLSSLQSGRTLPQAFEDCSRLPKFDSEVFIRSLGRWFKAWAADGLICGVETAGKPRA